MITATELLNFLTKAQKLGILEVTFRQTDEGYTITLRDDWYGEGKWSSKTVFISNKGESTWDAWDYDFETMNGMLDEKLEEQLQKEIRARKRQELIESLTPEQRELLGV